MLTRMITDESGFIISSELVLVATIVVIGMIVGLSEIQHAVVQELNDVADAIGSLNQSYFYSGFSKRNNTKGGVGAFTRGSAFFDSFDECDNDQCTLTCDPPTGEGPKFGGATCAGGIGGGSIGGSFSGGSNCAGGINR